MKKLFFASNNCQTNNMPGDRGEPRPCHYLAHFLEVDNYQCQLVVVIRDEQRQGVSDGMQPNRSYSDSGPIFSRLLPILVWFEFRQSHLFRRILILMLISSSGDQRQWQEWCLFIVFPINAAKKLPISSFRTKLRLCGTKLGCGEGGDK